MLEDQDDDEGDYLPQEVIRFLEELGCELVVEEPMEKALQRAILMIPDKEWGIRTSAKDHPGLCLSVLAEARRTVFLKGTDQLNRRAMVDRVSHVVEPDSENGLSKSTSFKLLPRSIRLHRVRLYLPERFLGRLNLDGYRIIVEKIGISGREQA